MQTKTRKYINPNFLNNQNYILGNQEKKKVLSKFFVEKNMKNILNLLNFFSSYINNIGHYLISYSFFILIIYVGTKYWHGIDGSMIFFIFIALGVIMPLFIKKNNYYSKISSIYEYFVNEKVYFSGGNQYVFQKIFNAFIIFFCGFIIIYLFIGKIETFAIFALVFLIQIIIPFFLIALLGKIILGLNYFNIILFPIFFIYQTIYSILSYINTFLFKGTKGYIILKKTINSFILNKFNIIEKNNAENEFYKISLK